MKTNHKGALYLIPNFLHEETPYERIFPEYNKLIVNQLNYFIAEHEKHARRFIKRILPAKPQNELHFFILNKHTGEQDLPSFLEPLHSGNSMGLISDAGMPAIADPGAKIVSLAHRQNIRVVPLTGPSSLFLALAASGLNGQHFEFHGYLPVDPKNLIKKIKQLESECRRTGKTQIFMETPYRNDRLIQFLLKNLHDDTRLCIAANLTGPGEKIQTLTVSQWRKKNVSLHKIPAVFLLGI